MAGSGLPPPNGDENRQGAILASTIVFLVITCFFVALRLATRIWIVRNVGADDYTILCATLGVIIGCGLVVTEIHYGFGRHKFYLGKWQYIEFLKYSYGEWIQTFQTLMFTKLSICFFLLRIPVEKRLIRPIQGAIIILVISNIILTLLWIFQCNPIAGAWNKETPSTCFTDAQLQRIIISQAIISIISDVALALFPIVILWHVRISLRIKVGLCSLMGLGLITAACCIVRTVMNWQNVNSDPSWEVIDNWYWRSIEVCFGIIIACIPALRPGYNTVSASLRSYMDRLSFNRMSSSALDKNGKPFKPQPDKALSDHLDPKKNSDHLPNSPIGAAAYAASAEVERAMEYGAGEEGFAMKSLPGDKKTQSLARGIRKTTQVDIDFENHRSSAPEDLERGDGTWFTRD